MSAYLLNLVFARPTAANLATGLFMSHHGTGANATSKIWYTLPAGWPSSVLTAPGWVNQSAPPLTSSLPHVPDESTFNCNLQDSIYVRAAPDAGWGSTPVAGLTLELGAHFGRPSTTGHEGDDMASPFVMQPNAGTGANSPCTFFAIAPPTTAGSNAGPDGSWIMYVGQAVQNVKGQRGGSIDPSRLRIYSFIVSALATLGSTGAYTYGHDPEMIIRG